MNEVVLDIIYIVLTSIVIPLISVLSGYLIKYINQSIKNKTNSKLLEDIILTISNSVRMIIQTYVDDLKKNHSFNDEEKKVALNKAKQNILLQLGKEKLEFIKNNYQDVDTFLNTIIEAEINKIKINK